MVLIAVVVGALFGGMLGNGPFGALAGALIAWLLVHARTQDSRIAALERAQKALAQAPGAAALLQPRPAAFSAPTPQPTAASGLDVEPSVNQTASLTAHEPASDPGSPAAPVEPVAQPAAWAAPSTTRSPASAAARAFDGGPPFDAPPSPWDKARAWLVGGNTIAKAGVGILFVGLAFLAKYAAEHTQVPVEVRLAGIGAVALVLLGLGWRLRSSRPGYAQALQGGAVAVLYLTLFVAFRFYGVLAVGPVFVLMVAVAALAAALAVLQDARPLAVIGALGGFATPLLVSTGSGNHLALFSFYLVLDVGIAVVAWFKSWRLLNAVGFVFTFGVAAAWGLTQYRPEHYASSQAFLIAYFLLFNAVLLLPARRAANSTTPRTDAWVNGSLLFGLPTICFVLQHGLVRHMAYGTALSALLLAGFYVLLAARMKRQPQLAVTFDASLAIAIVFLALVVPFALDARSTAGAWALEGAGLVWLGLRQQRRLPRGFGYVLLLLASAALVLSSLFHARPTAVFNALFLNALLVAAGALTAAFFVQREAATPGRLMRGEAWAEHGLIGLGTLWALAAVGVQVDALVQPTFELTAWLVGLSAIALIYLALSLRLHWPRLALPLMALAPLLACMVGMSAATLASPAQAGGWWAWPLALATQGLLLWRAAPQWPATAQRVVHALGPLVLAALGALQGRAITAAWGDDSSAWSWLGWLLMPALLLLLLPRPATAQRWPVHAAPSAYQGLAAAVLTVGLLVWALLANLFSDGSALPLLFVPLLNPLDLGVATALLACGLWLRSAAARAALGTGAPAFGLAVLGGSAFIWLNAMLVRAFHHYGGVPYHLDAWLHSLAVQTGITLLWSSTALVLMWLSAKRQLRLPWMLGAALLAAVVLKLLLVDLSGSGTVTRIVSFIGVGLLMLVIAYVAPLPSSEKTHEAT
jgi:uncharacterized membrane protein